MDKELRKFAEDLVAKRLVDIRMTRKDLHGARIEWTRKGKFTICDISKNGAHYFGLTAKHPQDKENDAVGKENSFNKAFDKLVEEMDTCPVHTGCGIVAVDRPLGFDVKTGDMLYVRPNGTVVKYEAHPGEAPLAGLRRDIERFAEEMTVAPLEAIRKSKEHLPTPLEIKKVQDDMKKVAEASIIDDFAFQGIRILVDPATTNITIF